MHSVLINEDSSYKDTSAVLDDAGNAINIKIFAHMTQFLDGQPLKIVIRDAKNDGRKAIETLTNHYLGCSKQGSTGAPAPARAGARHFSRPRPRPGKIHA